ncbi:c-type cytochrome biogenesis protein CcsB [Cumulibacter soli]|uniref:c-type cytochrome biogenesis protein CcsB n=1 Tax=Cumulibacter soli TaxID=2546344 RepID=UPI00106790CD|nr:c-type cytochrome biogenesis protein CcsB [Cumulibacter soli]
MNVAQLSDQLFVGAATAYALATICLAVLFAHTPVRRKALAVAAQRDPGDLLEKAEAAEPAYSTQRRRAWSAASMVMLLTGIALNAAAFLFRGIAAERFPLGNVYELLMLMCLVAAAYVAVAKPFRNSGLAVFVLGAVTILAFVAGTVVFTPAGPLMASLNSYWRLIHVTSISATSGLLLIPGVLGVLAIIQRRRERTTRSDDDRHTMWDKLPSSESLDATTHRVVKLAFPLYTFALIIGAVWAEAAWGRFWGWDPKETISLVTWLLYAAYLHARATAGWREKASSIAVAGLVSIIFNLFVINYLISGLHSYA